MYFWTCFLQSKIMPDNILKFFYCGFFQKSSVFFWTDTNHYIIPYIQKQIIIYFQIVLKSLIYWTQKIVFTQRNCLQSARWWKMEIWWKKSRNSDYMKIIFYLYFKRHNCHETHPYFLLSDYTHIRILFYI